MSTPEYSLSMDDDAGENVDVRNDPSANSRSKAVLTDVGAAPEIEPPEDSTVKLAYGFERDGEWYTDASVNELTGEAEEALAKAAGNPTRWMKTLLHYGVESLGPFKPTDDDLRDLLIADRDVLVLGIRRVTFGNDFEVKQYQCPGCGEYLDITVSLSDIPIKTLERGEDTFTVDLRRGSEARVKMPTGRDQEKILSDLEITDAERNTLLLAQAIQTLPSGPVRGSVSRVTSLGVVDRRAVLSALAERAPGPRYDDVSYKHECGHEFPLLLTVGALFQGL